MSMTLHLKRQDLTQDQTANFHSHLVTISLVPQTLFVGMFKCDASYGSDEVKPLAFAFKRYIARQIAMKFVELLLG